VAAIPQFYDEGGVPLRVDGDPRTPALAWQSQRARLRGWLERLPADRWHGPTRCSDWDATQLVRHLASGSQFLGFTLHQAGKGTATTLMRGFDTQTTVKAAVSAMGELAMPEALAAMAAMDASVDRELAAMGAIGWAATAEAAPGHLPAALVVQHFLFDSWVHEHDLLLPSGAHPPHDRTETESVVRYVMGMSAVLTGAARSFQVRVSDLELVFAVVVEAGRVSVTDDLDRTDGVVVEGVSDDLVDRACGRPAGEVHGDRLLVADLDRTATLFAG
jgi:uncharacterized protein (TIGR03083 family)